MKIVIVGDGKVGYTLAENLSREEHDITIVDKNPEALQRAHDNLDVMCVKGSGVSVNVLLKQVSVTMIFSSRRRPETK